MTWLTISLIVAFFGVPLLMVIPAWYCKLVYHAFLKFGVGEDMASSATIVSLMFTGIISILSVAGLLAGAGLLVAR